jgi:DNA-binding MarR family transcriptional regulator
VIQRLRGWHRNLFRLWLIDPDAEPVPLRQVATRMHFDPSNVTLISAKLDEKGAARRAPHPTEGRVRTLLSQLLAKALRRQV